MKIYPSDYLAALASGAIDHATDEQKLVSLIKGSEGLVNHVLDAHAEDGVTLPPLHDLYWREMLAFVSTKPATEDRIRLVLALQRNITGLVHEHHAYRHKHDGNVVWEFSGPTGMGKSSAMLGLMEWHNGVRAEDLEKHLTIDASRIPDLLPKLRKGSALAIDEQSQLVGEGSLTQVKLLRNVEDQIRATGVDVYWASPDSRDHATSQGEFQAFQVHHDKHYTRFLVWLNEIPLGYANLPWASAELWAAYRPIKARNVERAAKAAFNNPAGNDDHIRRLFDVPAVRRIATTRRVRVNDWRRLFRRFGSSVSTTQLQSIAEDIEFMLDTLSTRPDDFPEIFGWKPTPGMIDAAQYLRAPAQEANS